MIEREPDRTNLVCDCCGQERYVSGVRSWHETVEGATGKGWCIVKVRERRRNVPSFHICPECRKPESTADLIETVLELGFTEEAEIIG